MKLKGPELPDGIVTFAREIASIADKFKVDRFEMMFEPKELRASPTYIQSGTLRINYTSKDGRGRPSKRLTITCQTTTIEKLIDEPESY
jgi:hypothetical protein